MCQVVVNIPDEVLCDTKMTERETEDFVKRAVAICYYTQSGLSVGSCAVIAGMSEKEFIKYLSQSPRVHLSV